MIPVGFEAGEQAGRMIPVRVQVHGVQHAVQILTGLERRQTIRNIHIVYIKVRLRKAVAGTGCPLLAQQLIHAESERPFAIIQGFP